MSDKELEAYVAPFVAELTKYLDPANIWADSIREAYLHSSYNENELPAWIVGVRASAYIIEETKTARHDPTKTFKVVTGMHCPRCSAVLPLLEHGKRRRCSECNLDMQLIGEALFLSALS